MKNAKIKASTLRRLLGTLKKRSLLLVCTLLCAAVYVVASIMIPVLVGDAIDLAVEKGNVDFDGISIILIKIAIFAGVACLAQYLMNLLNNRITYGTVADLRKEAFSRIQKIPFSYLDKTASGDIISRITTDTDQLGDGLLTGFTQLFTGVITIGATLVIMIINSPLIAIAVVLMTPLSMVAARLVSKKSYTFFREQAELRGKQTAYTNEIIGGQKTVRAYSYESETEKVFEESNEKLKAASLKATFWSSLTNPVTRFVNSMVYAVVALVGALTSIATNGAFSVGMLTRMLAYANQYTKPFNEISGVITELQGAIAASERLFELMDTELETPDAEGQLESVIGNV